MYYLCNEIKNKNNMITLFTSIIEDYNQLRKDYEDMCEDMGIEPKEDGQYDWFYDIVKDDFDNFLYELKALEKKYPYNYYLCVGSVGLWNGRCDGGTVSNSIVRIVLKLARSVDDFEFKLNEKGQIEFKGLHHDGRNYYTITMLNLRANKVVRCYNDCDLVGNRELNEKLSKDFFMRKIVDEKDLY